MTEPRTFLAGRVTVHHGDSRDVLKGMADASVDSVVCDPPYALVSIVKRFGGKNAAPTKDGDVYARSSAGFMGQAWDTGETAFAAEFWTEVLRVLKPGGHVLAFSGTRTYHRLACAIEDAGFEIRDMTAWLYGSGFPKSHDVSKGIDRSADYRLQSAVRRAAVEAVEAAGLAIPGNSRHDWTIGEHAPGDKWWAEFRAWLPGLSDEDRERVEGAIVATVEKTAGWFTRGDIYAITAPATPEAAQWQGWGTALKPALEPIVLARKPLIGTVAANVLEHGTGALNIDGCRVGTDGGTKATNFVKKPDGRLERWDEQYSGARNDIEPIDKGRWPANVIHDGSDEVLAAFPQTESGLFNGKRSADKFRSTYGAFKGTAEAENPTYGDSGSAARFFYTAKADGLDRLGSKHPTVKPVDLMRYLCRLITPKEVWYCPQCDIQEYEKNSPQDARETETLRGMRDGVSTEGQPARRSILQPEVCGKSSGPEADAMRVVRDGVSASKGRRASVLQQAVLEQAHGGAPEEPQAISYLEEGLQVDLDAAPSAGERSRGVSLRTQVDHGAIDRTSSAPSGGGPSQERCEDGQSPREFGADEQGRSRQAEPPQTKHAVLPSLPGQDRHKPTCSHCGHSLAKRPGRVLDPFAGTGTTGEAAWLEGFSAVLIEREAEYVADIERRMSLCLAGPEEKARAIIKAKGKVEAPGPLFAEAAE